MAFSAHNLTCPNQLNDDVQCKYTIEGNYVKVIGIITLLVLAAGSGLYILTLEQEIDTLQGSVSRNYEIMMDIGYDLETTKRLTQSRMEMLESDFKQQEPATAQN